MVDRNGCQARKTYFEYEASCLNQENLFSKSYLDIPTLHHIGADPTSTLARCVEAAYEISCLDMT
jgi:hypothetical protein